MTEKGPLLARIGAVRDHRAATIVARQGVHHRRSELRHAARSHFAARYLCELDDVDRWKIRVVAEQRQQVGAVQLRVRSGSCIARRNRSSCGDEYDALSGHAVTWSS